jgi:hypothetical protein
MSCPTKYTRPTVKRILRHIALGLPLTLVCQAVGINFETFSNWRRQRPRFAEAVLRARAKGADARLRKIERASAGDWRAAAWLLEHTLPEHFAKSRLEVTGSDGGPLVAGVQLYLPKKDAVPGESGAVVDLAPPALAERSGNGH